MKRDKMIIPLSDVTDADQQVVGAKAIGLARLKRLNLPVADAYEAHINSPLLKTVIDDALVFCGNPESFDIARNLGEIRRAIVDSMMNGLLTTEIESHYHALAADRLAVRSSATAEDLPDHSFAGLYDTYLGIANIDDCLIAIKKCWASLWTERAFVYRQKNHFDPRKVKMAVIVQSLIEAEVSGVLFTADPLSGDDRRIFIEACPGFGDILVSGRVSPDRFVMDKKGPNVLSRSLVAPCINNQTAQKLAELALKVESKFGCPQDIEWSVCRDRIFFLQSRPITTIPRAKSWEDRQIWSSIAARESIPDVVTPATFSTLRSFEEKMSKSVFNVLCINEVNIPTFDLVAGRVYFNASLWAAVIRHFRIIRNLDWGELAGSEPEFIRLLEKLKNIPAEDLPEVRHNRVKFILKLPLLIADVLGNTRRKSQSILAIARKTNEKWACLGVSNLSAEQLTDYLMEAVTDIHEGVVKVSSFLCMIYWIVYFPILDIVCKRWIPDEQSCAGRLLAGLGNMEDAEAGLDLWRLAVRVSENPDLKELVQSNVKWDIVCEGLAKSNSGEEFLAEWKRFMKVHGHHCRGEVEFYNRRWSETHDYILGILRGFINSTERSNLLENHRRIVEQREQLEKECRQRLKNPVKRAVFNHLLARAQYGSVFRENFKSEVIKLLASVRSILLELGRKLAASSLIADSDDVFFLNLEELGQLAHSRTEVDIRQIIAARRADYEKWQSISPPSVIFGRFNPDTYIPVEVNAGAELLNGLAVSPGVASGKARVILRSDDSEQVQAGEILIAPFTDPGWTPYFIHAAGIVMEQGGLLSHGAVVAREYGIPAVVNVGNATKIIKTGQTIQVDGNKGIVRLS
jgi:pyruvate,water dikinase